MGIGIVLSGVHCNDF